MKDFRVPMTANEFHKRLVERGLLPDGVFVRSIVIHADGVSGEVVMTAELLADDRLTDELPEVA